VVGSDHVRVILVDAGLAANVKSASLAAIAFRSAETQLGQFLLGAQGKTIHLAGQIRINEWQGKQSAQFIIEDAGY
jgi:single-stranded-DNA-specific exonuclease